MISQDCTAFDGRTLYRLSEYWDSLAVFTGSATAKRERKPTAWREYGLMLHKRYHFLDTFLVEMSNNDERLEMELEALPWRESRFKMWVPKNEIPNRVVASLEQHHGKFHGEEFDYYLSKSGVINKYSTFGDSAN